MGTFSGDVHRGPDCSDVDIDSTIQESNMAYPADSCLLKKLGSMSRKVAGFLNQRLTQYIKDPLKVNMKRISKKARSYFFLPKKTTTEIKNKTLSSLLSVIQEEITPVIDACKNLDVNFIEIIPWNFKRTINQIKELAEQYLKDVKKYLRTGFLVTTKRLSFHLQDVACFSKGKLGKKYQFGRGIQLGRITGNFFFVGKCDSD